MLLPPKLHVSVAAGGDVEVALDFVSLEGAIDAAGVGRFPAVEFGCFLEFLRRVVPHVAEDVGDVLVFFFGAEASGVGVAEFVAGARVGGLGAAVAGLAGAVPPEGEEGIVFFEEVPGHDAVHGCVLDVDVEVGAAHGEDDVKV